MIADSDDTVLMERYRDGDLAAFEVLYRRHKGPLFRYLSRQCKLPDVAADVFQEVWSRVIASRERYAVRATFKTFLFRIAHHCVIDHYRSQQRRRADRTDPVENYGETLMTSAEEQPEVLAARAQLDGRFRQALADLPAEQSEVFVLSEEAGLSLHEIAEITGVPHETVKSRLRYAIAKLRRAMAEDYGPAALTPARAET